MNYWESIWSKFVEWIEGFAPRLIGAILLLVVGWWLTRLLCKAIRRAMQRGKADSGIISFVYSICKVTLQVIVVISAAAQLGVNVSSIIAAVGATGVTLGLALKDSLANLASGMLLIINKPFHVGDYLETENLQGTVSKIEMTFTTLTTFDNKTITIPNSRLTANNIVNYSAMDTRRLDLTYTVGYQDDLSKVKELISRLITENDKILKQPEPIVAIGEHQASGIAVVAKVWCKKDDYWPAYYEMQEKVKLEFDAQGITIPYNQMDVHLVPPSEQTDEPGNSSPSTGHTRSA